VLWSGAPDCPVPHEDRASNGRPAPSPNDRISRRRTGHCPVAHRTVRCAHRQQPSPTATIWLVAINTTPSDHFKLWEPKQHFKSYSWHIQALLTTSIHWSILYTRFRPLQPTQVPQKREQAKKASRVSLALVPCEIHWEKVCATSCVHLCVEFWLPLNFLQSFGGL
jgi:hypothetical protein